MIFDADRNGQSNDEVFSLLDFFSSFSPGVLTFDEFLGAYIQMQRGKNLEKTSLDLTFVLFRFGLNVSFV